MEKHVLCDRPLRGSWFLQLSGWKCVRWSISRLSFLIDQTMIDSILVTDNSSHTHTHEKTKNMHLHLQRSNDMCFDMFQVVYSGWPKDPTSMSLIIFCSLDTFFLSFIVHETNILSQNTLQSNNKPLLNKRHKLITHYTHLQASLLSNYTLHYPIFIAVSLITVRLSMTAVYKDSGQIYRLSTPF